MTQIHDNLTECLRNENLEFLVPESTKVIRYNSECQYARPENCCTGYETYFEIISDFTAGPVNDICLLEESKENMNGKITAELVYNGNDGYFQVGNSLKNQGPKLSVECKLTNIAEANFERKFGLIQFANTFIERKFETAIIRVDFLENLLRGRDVVLDCVDGNDSCRPFYSEESLVQLRANEIPPEEMTLTMIDCPDSTTPLEFNRGPLQHLERHQRFYVYLVMEYWDTGESRYKVFHTFDWFFYWYYTSHTNNFRCEFGINRHKTPILLPAFDISRTCNSNQILHGIDLPKKSWEICPYPDLVSEKEKDCIRNAVIDINGIKLDE